MQNANSGLVYFDKELHKYYEKESGKELLYFSKWYEEFTDNIVPDFKIIREASDWENKVHGWIHRYLIDKTFQVSNSMFKFIKNNVNGLENEFYLENVFDNLKLGIAGVPDLVTNYTDEAGIEHVAIYDYETDNKIDKKRCGFQLAFYGLLVVDADVFKIIHLPQVEGFDDPDNKVIVYSLDEINNYKAIILNDFNKDNSNIATLSDFDKNMQDKILWFLKYKKVIKKFQNECKNLSSSLYNYMDNNDYDQNCLKSNNISIVKAGISVKLDYDKIETDHPDIFKKCQIETTRGEYIVVNYQAVDNTHLFDINKDNFDSMLKKYYELKHKLKENEEFLDIKKTSIMEEMKSMEYKKLYVTELDSTISFVGATTYKKVDTKKLNELLGKDLKNYEIIGERSGYLKVK
jgi:hypothetical protein